MSSSDRTISIGRFARTRPYHKLVIHQTLNELVSSKFDIVQAGDSTGLHGIRPMLDARARPLLNYADPRELTLRVK